MTCFQEVEQTVQWPNCLRPNNPMFCYTCRSFVVLHIMKKQSEYLAAYQGDWNNLCYPGSYHWGLEPPSHSYGCPLCNVTVTILLEVGNLRSLCRGFWNQLVGERRCSPLALISCCTEEILVAGPKRWTLSDLVLYILEPEIKRALQIMWEVLSFTIFKTSQDFDRYIHLLVNFWRDKDTYIHPDYYTRKQYLYVVCITISYSCL